MRRAQIARLTKLESLSLNCGHPRDGFKDGGGGIIQLVKELPHLTLLRVQPFTAFGSFLGDWEFVADCKARRIAPGERDCMHALPPRVTLWPTPAHRLIMPSSFMKWRWKARARTPIPAGPASRTKPTLGLT